MARIPSVQDFGGTPTPAASRPMPNARGVGRGVARGADIMTAEANRSGGGLAAFGEGIREAGEAIARAEDGMRARADAVEMARDLGTFSEATQTELRRLQTESDFSRPETVEQYRTFLNEESQKILGAHKGGPASRFRLAERMAALRTSQIDTAARLSFDTGQKLLTNHFAQSVNGRAEQALKNPSSVPQLLTAIEQDIEDLAPGLAPETEMLFRSLARGQVAHSAVDGFLNRGEWKKARELLQTTPGLDEIIGPERRRALDGRISAFELEEVKARTAGERKLMEAEQIAGRKLTLAERVKLAGLEPSAGAETPAQKIANIEAALGRTLTDPERERVAGIGIDAAKITDIASARKEFARLSGDFITIRNSFDQIKAVAARPSAAGDVAMIFSYMKMLDPTSVVREGEQATAANAAGVDDRLRNTYNRLLTGERLTTEQRGDFIAQSENIYLDRLGKQRALERQFSAVAQRQGMDPRDVVLDFVSQQPGDTQGTGAPRIRYDLQGNRIGGATTEGEGK